MTGWQKVCNCSTTPEPFPSSRISIDFSAEKLWSLSAFFFFSSWVLSLLLSMPYLFQCSESEIVLVIKHTYWWDVWAVLAVLPVMYSLNLICLPRSLKRCEQTSDTTGKYFSPPLWALDTNLLMFSISWHFHLDNAVSSVLKRIWTLQYQLRFRMVNPWISVRELVWKPGPGF